MQENFAGVEFSNIVTVFRKTRKIHHYVFMSFKNITFHFKVVHCMSKKCTKSNNTCTRAKTFFAQKTIIFYLHIAVVFTAIR